LENRVPFMDNDLVDFAMQCPVGLKLNNLKEVLKINENDPGNKSSQYFQKTNDGKQILRDVMKRYIPDEIAQAEKKGFSSPDASWFKKENMEFVKRKLLIENSTLFDYLDVDSVRMMINQHLDGQKNKRLLIWSLLCTEEMLSCPI
jgi:asparagine synthase (glutamine-hydrolysing)